MPIKVFNTCREGSVLIVSPVGNISNFIGAIVQPEVDSLLETIRDEDIKNVIFDLQEVPYFGSVLLGAMHSIWKRVRGESGRVVLCHVSDLGREILEATRFDLVWPIYTTRNDALAALDGRSEQPA